MNIINQLRIYIHFYTDAVAKYNYSFFVEAHKGQSPRVSQRFQCGLIIYRRNKQIFRCDYTEHRNDRAPEENRVGAPRLLCLCG